MPFLSLGQLFVIVNLLMDILYTYVCKVAKMVSIYPEHLH